VGGLRDFRCYPLRGTYATFRAAAVPSVIAGLSRSVHIIVITPDMRPGCNGTSHRDLRSPHLIAITPDTRPGCNGATPVHLPPFYPRPTRLFKTPAKPAKETRRRKSFFIVNNMV
jgi:hypothetical protein